MTLISRKYGLPFRRYMSAVSRHLIPVDALSKDSVDWKLDPFEGKWIARNGTTSYGVGLKNAIMESGQSGWPNDIQEIVTASAVDGYPIHLVQMGDALCYWDTNSWSVGTVTFTQNDATVTTAAADGFEDVTVGTYITHPASGFEAYVSAINSTTSIEMDIEWTAATIAGTATVSFTGAHRTVGQTGADANHYPSNFKCIPLLSSAGLHRCQTAAQRATLSAGTKRLTQAGDDLCCGAYDAVPVVWNKTYNTNLSSGSNNERIMPWGQIMPLHPGTISQTASADADGTWPSGSSFYWTVVFVDGNGAHSQPFVPRPKNTLLPNGLGLYSITGVATDKRRALTISGIPVGPEGTARRILYRTPLSTSIDTLSLESLAKWEDIPNNTTTEIESTKGNDNELSEDPVNFHFFHLWAPPARYAWKADHRVFVGFTSVHPGAFVIAPREFLDNNDETAGGTTYKYEVNGSFQLVLYKGASSTTIALSGLTLEELIDTINATTDSGSNGGQWSAQMVPNADPQGLAADLLPTTSKDLGDGASTVRAYSNAYPGVHYWGLQTTQAKRKTEMKRRFFFTEGGPGIPAYAHKSFHRDNIRTAPASAGDLMGGAALLDGSIICFRNKIGIFRNIKSGKSGEDVDYRLEFINENRGCCAPQSIVEGDGWVGYMTVDGYVVTDGRQEVIISGDIHNPNRRTVDQSPGDLAGDVAQAISNYSTTGYCVQFPTRVIGNEIWMVGLGYNINQPYRTLIYNYSAGAGGSGLDEILQPSGAPWGWSTPLTLGIIAIGSVARSSGREAIGMALTTLYHWLKPDARSVDFDEMEPSVVTQVTTNTTPGLANRITSPFTFNDVGNGARIVASGIPSNTFIASLIDEFTAIITNNATAAATVSAVVTGRRVLPVAYCAQDLVESHKKKSAQRVTAYYYKNRSGMKITHSRDSVRNTQRSMTLPLSGASEHWTRVVKDLPTPARTLGELVEMGFTDDGSTSSGRPQFFGMEVEVELSEGYQ